MKSNHLKAFSLIALVSVVVSVALMAARSYYAISFAEPLQGATRGAEYENLYSIWKYVFGGTVYTDQNRVPFAGSYYNWLFYAAYGEITDLVLRSLSLSDAWLPTITRLITLCGLFLGSILAYRSFVDLLEIEDRALKILSGAISGFIFFGPLIGFFGISATPDIWPLVFTVVAIWLFIKHYDSHPLKTVMLVCALSYLSWGFKQNFIYIPATVGLYLLLRRQWRDAAILTLSLCAAGAVTLIIGGPVYAKLLYFGGTFIYLSLDQFLINVTNFSIKSLPLLAAAAALAMALATSPEARRAVAESIRKRPTMLVLFLGLLISLIEALPTSAIIYAAEHHYFTFSYFLAFAVLAATVWLARTTALSNIFLALLFLGWAGNVLASSSVLLGLKGVLSVRPHHESLMADKLCLADLREPIFVSNPYLALPWMIEAKQHFVLHMNYSSDRAAGIEKEGGGIGGLIDRGYFATLVLSGEQKGHFDGSDLEFYRQRPGQCSNLVVYDRIDRAKPENN